MASQPSTSVFLTDDHYNNLVNAQANLEQIRRELVLAKQAGIPVDALQQQYDQQTAQIRLYKATYFPGRP